MARQAACWRAIRFFGPRRNATLFVGYGFATKFRRSADATVPRNVAAAHECRTADECRGTSDWVAELQCPVSGVLAVRTRRRADVPQRRRYRDRGRVSHLEREVRSRLSRRHLRSRWRCEYRAAARRG